MSRSTIGTSVSRLWKKRSLNGLGADYHYGRAVAKQSATHMEISTTRRNFMKVSAAAGGAVSFGFASKLFAASENPKPLRILILGGTGFTGPAQVRYAIARGHKVTVFNRGKTHKGELPEGVEQLIGDRNGQLDALKGKTWDVAIDNPTMLPAWVRDAAEILKGNVNRYVFIRRFRFLRTTANQAPMRADPF